jgi:hypothetical protein
MAGEDDLGEIDTTRAEFDTLWESGEQAVLTEKPAGQNGIRLGRGAGRIEASGNRIRPDGVRVAS